MDYHSMSLIELKQAAKNHVPKIKQYYIKSRLELIQILVMKELPESFRIEKLTLAALRTEAKEKGLVKNVWNLRKKDLLALLYPSTQEQNENNQDGEKHDNPQNRERKNVRIEI